MMKDIGYWDALAWGSLFALFLVIAYLLVRRKPERKADAFLCGESYEYTTPAHHFFFGFEKSLAPLFSAWERFHAGVINEYVAWVLIFGLIVSLLFILMAFVLKAKVI